MISVQKYESRAICCSLRIYDYYQDVKNYLSGHTLKNQLKPALREWRIRNSFINRDSRIRIEIWGNL